MRTLLFVLAAAGCAPTAPPPGDTETGEPGTDGTELPLDPATVPLAGECDQAERQGRFEVESNEDYSYVVGEIADGMVPSEVLTKVLVDGDCTIWQRENPFCDPGCEPGYTCDLDGNCVPYPEAQDLGLVTVSGLEAPVQMEPVVPGNSYFDTSLGNPPWTPRTVLTLETEGGAYDPLTLHAVTPDSFSLTGTEWLLVPGEPFELSWEPAPEGARTEVVLSMRIDQHGLTPSTLTCAFADDGTGTVPAAAFNALVEFGITGFPTGEIERRTVDHVALSDGGCAEFAATESRLPSLEIEGYTPCRRDQDCPEGQECNELLERCE